MNFMFIENDCFIIKPINIHTDIECIYYCTMDTKLGTNNLQKHQERMAQNYHILEEEN